MDFIKSLSVFLVLLLANTTAANDKVALQLKWEHEFQFVGYYAAKWQGFYAEVGLDVDIRSGFQPDGSALNPHKELVEGRAQFAIGDIDILSSANPVNKLLILATIYQQSPLAIFSLRHVPLSSLKQLSTYRIALVPDGNSEIQIRMLFLENGLDPDLIKLVDEPVTIETLIDGRADAILTYDVSATYAAREKNVSVNQMRLSDFGLPFYGDTLFTTARFQEMNPEIVENFLKASLKGWQFAIENREQMARKISNELPRYFFQYDKPLAYNLAFAQNIKKYTRYPEVPLGYVNKQRWKNTSQLMLASSALNQEYDFDNSILFYEMVESDELLTYGQLISSLVLLALIFFAWSKRALYATIGLVVTISLVIVYQVESRIKLEQMQIARINTLKTLGSISAKLKGELQTSMSMLRSFAAFISANPDITETEYERFAKEMLIQSDTIVNFAAAPDLVVKYIYPLAGNEKVLGLNYREMSAQKPMVMRVIESRQALLEGPINLVQGNQALIGRAPVYYLDSNNKTEFWGIVSTPIHLTRLLQQAGVQNEGAGYDLAIRTFDALGKSSEAFFGDNALFDDPATSSINISVAGGSWEIVAKPKRLAESTYESILITRSIFFLSTLLLIFYVHYRFTQEKERKRLRSDLTANQQMLQKVGVTAKIAGIKVNRHFDIVAWSDRLFDVLKLPQDTPPANLNEFSSVLANQELEQLKTSISYGIESRQPFDVELATFDGKHWVRVQGEAEPDHMHAMVVLQDITEKVRTTKLIEYQANYDALTQLPNRTLFYERLANAIEKGTRSATKIAVLFLDLDRFKPINDNHGHDMGDKLLQQVAERIKSVVRDSDTVARLSGDEFGVILSDLKDYRYAVNVTEKVLEKVNAAYEINKVKMFVSVSIGISIFPNDGDEPQSLTQKADQAMYEVKRSGRNGWQFYTRDMQQRSEYRHNLLTSLIQDIDQHKLETYYQPIYDLNNGKIVKLEALARWEHNGKFIPPNEFIPIAEESGLINKIDLLMLENACRFLIEMGDKNIGLSVNISPRLFQTKDKALEIWLESIQHFSSDISITVEMTERLLTEESVKATKVLEQLHNAGIKIAIDDFGTGYSSLSYLVKFPVDIIKIDASFVDKIGVDKSAESLIETILAMAEKMSLSVIAEGIETIEQLNYLKHLGCPMGQGYLMSRPKPDKDLDLLTPVQEFI